MKAALTILFVIVSGASALANADNQVNEITLKIETHDQTTGPKMDILLDRGIVVAPNVIEVEIANGKSVARLYKFKNSRIKKALSFTTKKNKAKMA